ncbi:Os04g0509700 [Oryza sativa Japonica Group]|uniref:Os04g0509700 protein n=1 Tax=Oryza sativa subsp. japonica TaxID=39947 RepID=A0A0P0WCJ0_ORYSJ|nr:Os04g0509700 [Oryza sativa Japonica Group]
MTALLPSRAAASSWRTLTLAQKLAMSSATTTSSSVSTRKPCSSQIRNPASSVDAKGKTGSYANPSGVMDQNLAGSYRDPGYSGVHTAGSSRPSASTVDDVAISAVVLFPALNSFVSCAIERVCASRSGHEAQGFALTG